MHSFSKIWYPVMKFAQIMLLGSWNLGISSFGSCLHPQTIYIIVLHDKMHYSYCQVLPLNLCPTLTIHNGLNFLKISDMVLYLLHIHYYYCSLWSNAFIDIGSRCPGAYRTPSLHIWLNILERQLSVNNHFYNIHILNNDISWVI